jgi:hypothetical protein
MVQKILSKMLAKVARFDSGNPFSPKNLKPCMQEYLEFMKEEAEQFPEICGEDHWNLDMADGNPTKPATYIAYVFRKQSVVVCCGRGDGFQIRGFAEREFEGEPSELPDALYTRFGEPFQRIELSLDEVNAWLKAKA